jgi:ubiquitin C-terminal hydrolase
MQDSSSNNGKVGLSNLGNTCYMNSSIQCLSNTYELTRFFLDRKYKDLIDREWKNPLGTEGRLVKAWAKLTGEMWRSNQQVVRPELFKRFLGEYNVTFQGYGQHDSQECINTILDFISEDLYKGEKKPYVEQTETEGKSDEVASYEAWNKHILRNESFIQDLFAGQFRSKLTCSVCKRVSITFDPFSMVSVPIVSVNYVEVDGYLMSYHIDENYQNFKWKFTMRDD